MGRENGFEWETLPTRMHRCLSRNRISTVPDIELAPPILYTFVSTNLGNQRARGTSKRARPALEQQSAMRRKLWSGRFGMVCNARADEIMAGERAGTLKFMWDIVREGQEHLGASLRGGHVRDI